MDLAVALQLLPSGLVVPPLPYLLALAVAALLVGGAVTRVDPPVTGRTVVALTPWMVTGAALHALEQLGGAPDALVPLFGAPAVYVTTALAAGAVWVGSEWADGSTPTVLALVGGVAALVGSGAVLGTGLARGSLALVVPVAGLLGSVTLAGGTYWLLGRRRPRIVAAVGAAGPVVVFGHVLDGVSTALGVDLLGVGERSPLPRAILGVADSLPTAPVVGSGWLFVVVKLTIAVAVLLLFEDFVAEEPRTANALLAVVAAVGLGPGAHNLLLFAAAGA